jgi:hypothetical protein
MPFYRDHVYPHLVSKLGNPKPIGDIRHRIVPLAQGDVLEIGVGPGVNFTHYDPARVSKVYALEPNPGMLRRWSGQFGCRTSRLRLRWMRMFGDTLFAFGALVLGWFVLGLITGAFIRSHSNARRRRILSSSGWAEG